MSDGEPQTNPASPWSEWLEGNDLAVYSFVGFSLSLVVCVIGAILFGFIYTAASWPALGQFRGATLLVPLWTFSWTYILRARRQQIEQGITAGSGLVGRSMALNTAILALYAVGIADGISQALI